MDPSQWDWMDWLKALGYGAMIGGYALSALGDKRSAATLRGVASGLGAIGGFVDLVEPPRHCGRRATYDARLGGYFCMNCGSPVASGPKFGFDS